MGPGPRLRPDAPGPPSCFAASPHCPARICSFHLHMQGGNEVRRSGASIARRDEGRSAQASFRSNDIRQPQRGKLELKHCCRRFSKALLQQQMPRNTIVRRTPYESTLQQLHGLQVLTPRIHCPGCLCRAGRVWQPERPGTSRNKGPLATTQAPGTPPKPTRTLTRIAGCRTCLMLG